MKTAIRLAAAALITMLVGILSQPSGVASPGLAGTYMLDRGASQDVGKAVETVVEQMSFLVRSIARERLMAANPLPPRIAISFVDNAVTIQTGDGQAITTPTDGTPIDWTQEDGDAAKISAVWEGGKLKRSVVSKNGMRVSTYGLDPTGNTLTLQVVITASQLPQPLDYKLVFRRSS